MQSARVTSRQAGPRRGTVLIFALAILAVLALLGATYVTRANLDRVAAEASAQRASRERQPELVVNAIRDVLKADLFGNKLVTVSTPETVSGEEVMTSVGSVSSNEAVRLTPTMFEDGEHWDYPSVDEVAYDDDAYTFGRPGLAGYDNDLETIEPPRTEAMLRYDAALGMFERAAPDDAWLSATEPVDDGGVEALGSYDGRWDSWPQITNLRSVYRWDPDPLDDGSGGAWVRDDGRYADLSAFFLSDVAASTGFGDPSADLLVREGRTPATPFYDPNDAGSLLSVTPNDVNGALLGVEQRNVFGRQMNMLEAWYEDGVTVHNEDDPYEPIDERFWADTDGDGRPDARWTVIDDLAGAEGLIWVAAVRIADSSAAVNVNTSLEWFPEEFNGVAADYVGDGSTPMDVDLRRLIEESSGETNSSAGAGVDLRHPDVLGLSDIDLNRGMSAHLSLSLGLDDDLYMTLDGYLDPLDMENEALEDVVSWKPGVDGAQQGTPDRWHTTRAQRETHWRLFGSRPRDPLVRGGGRYDLSEEVDLKATWGANYPGVKSLEGRFDGAVQPGRLPGQSMSPGDSDPLGPLRSAERSDSVSTFDETAGPSVARPGNLDALTQQDKIERIQKDVRRSLTVASGASARSVIPALNGGYGDGRLKPRANDLAESPVRSDNRPSELSEVFGALTWALAPLATNRPLMRTLMHPDPANPTVDPWTMRYSGMFAEDPDYHYGGGPMGPARQWAVDPSVNISPDAMGPSYAIWRAASMAVNLRDAVDKIRVNDPMTVGDDRLIERPTVARLFPTPSPDLNSYQGMTVLDGVEVLTTSFAHGDVHGSLDPPLPGQPGTAGGTAIIPEALSMPQFGTSFVGLDRQPFISEAGVLCMYSYTESISGMNLPDPVMLDDPSTVIGRAIFAVELINPWEEDLQVSDEFTIALTDGNELIEIPLPNETIPAGERFVFRWSSFDSGDTEFIDSRDAFDADIGFPPALVVDPITFDDADRPFEGWDTNETAVLLYRTVSGAQLLLDRLSHDGMDEFPSVYDGFMLGGAASGFGLASATVDDPDITSMMDDVGIRFASYTALKRSGAEPVNGGFPHAVIESPSRNALVAEDPDGTTATEGWHVTPSGVSHYELIMPEISGDELTLGTDNANGGLALTEGFQLFVPNSKLLSAAELGMISVFAHTYRHESLMGPEVMPVDADPASSRWRTVSEELGKAYHLSYDGASTNLDHPYLGVLDPTRYVLGMSGDLETVAGLPDQMATPLALRVYDAFEAMEDSDTGLTRDDALVEGRINLNTAPKRVLATLPLTLPVRYSTGNVPSELSMSFSDRDNSYARLNALLQYRERLGISASFNPADTGLGWNQWYTGMPVGFADQLTGIFGLRTRYDQTGAVLAPAASADLHRKGRGFSSLGEPSILSAWAGAVPAPGSGVMSGYLELGANMIEDTLDTTRRDALDVRPMSVGGDVSPTEPVDDYEERLAVFRGMANSSSVRSDVYHAWFILRAYAPQDIEAITIDPMLPDRDRAALLNELTPEFEHRGFVVLDRSNVREPTDRPRVLIQTELDSTTASN